MIERLFRLRENQTTFRTEILAGLTTFMTMAYILVVNPQILKDAGMDFGAVFTATALSSLIAKTVGPTELMQTILAPCSLNLWSKR